MAKAVSQPRRPAETQGKRRCLSQKGSGKHRAKALSQPRRPWEHKAKGAVSAMEAAETQGKGAVSATEAVRSTNALSQALPPEEAAGSTKALSNLCELSRLERRGLVQQDDVRHLDLRERERHCYTSRPRKPCLSVRCCTLWPPLVF